MSRPIFNPNSNLFATSDLSDAVSLVRNAESQGRKGIIIYIGDPIEAPDSNKHGVTIANGVPFCPDYNVLSLYINGQFAEFQNAYIQTLRCEPAIRIFNAIIMSLMVGNDAILYFPAQTIDLKYPELLLEFFVVNYGITAGTKNTECTFVETFAQNIIDQLYVFDSITVDDYVKNVPQINPTFMQKLKADARAYYHDDSILQMDDITAIKYLSGCAVKLPQVEVKAQNAFTIG